MPELAVRMDLGDLAAAGTTLALVVGQMAPMVVARKFLPLAVGQSVTGTNPVYQEIVGSKDLECPVVKAPVAVKTCVSLLVF